MARVWGRWYLGKGMDGSMGRKLQWVWVEVSENKQMWLLGQVL